ncbi:hypothetical protein UCDDS831_g07715 [Diplodia seriata]|uniref:Uncharacterized protein n=1 Tax=Diplodia seriata TaxID=420778 RepID=A0A0G2GDX3_9PEZI|nr:hypothetical protein UCDDS831_g07715 [Diplodia seriata]
MSSPDPVLSLRLRQGVSAGNDILQLHRPSFDNYNNLQITTFSSKRTVILSCCGLRSDSQLDIGAALHAGLLELVGDQHQHSRDQHAAAPPGELAVPPRPSPEGAQLLAGLEIGDSASWKDSLEVGKTYVLRFAADDGDDGRKAWCRYADDDSNDKLPVALDRSSSIRFTVWADAAPPALSAVFSVEPPVAHRSGSPPFRFVVELTCDSSSSSSPASDGSSNDQQSRPVTVCTQRTSFGANLPVSGSGLNSVEQLVHCVDVASGTEPDWPARFECFDSDPWGAFPPADQFVELAPGATWRFEYTLDRAAGLGELVAGHRYRVEMADEAKEGFGMWMVGSKEELLRGSLEERKERWKPGPRGRGKAGVRQVNGPVFFEVVE